MKKINKLQLKKSVVANLDSADANQLAGGNDTTAVRTLFQVSNPCSGIVSCYPTARNCVFTGAVCQESLMEC